VIVSRHFLRRTARRKCHRLEAKTGHDYRVTKAVRGPYRWFVVTEEYNR
jgi:hypothetical protein